MLTVLGSGACATTPGQIHVLADADSPSKRVEATTEALRWLSDRSADPALRISAARVLGRLKTKDPEVVRSLRETVKRSDEPLDLRCMSAWALGELRTSGSLRALSEALRGRLKTPLDRYVLEGLAKHLALMANDEETLLSVVENLVFHAGNREGAPPAIYSLLSEQTRTVEVNVEVLSRTVRVKKKRTPKDEAALYNAVLELLTRLDQRRDEIAAGPSVWRPRIDAAVEVARESYARGDLRTQLFIIYLLGRLATIADVASRVGDETDELRLSRPPRRAQALVATWLLDRLQLSSRKARQALAGEILTGTEDAELLRLISDLGRPRRREVRADAPQRWLSVEVGAR